LTTIVDSRGVGRNAYAWASPATVRAKVSRGHSTSGGAAFDLRGRTVSYPGRYSSIRSAGIYLHPGRNLGGDKSQAGALTR
jgi:hypothetical protein